MDINQAKDTVIQAGKELVKRGLIARTWGNVSQKVNDHTMVITPSGKDYLSLTRDDIVAVNIDTLEYDGEVKPSSEKGVHANCYKYKDANFVIHTHQLFASAISACDIDGFKPKTKNVNLGSRVLCAGYGLPGTKKLSENVVKALKATDGSAIIMKNHGAVCFGKSFEETFETANQLETACQAYIQDRYLEMSSKSDADDAEIARYVLESKGVKIGDEKSEIADFSLEDRLIVANQSAETIILSFIHTPLKPMVDDFAQIVGVKMCAVGNDVMAVKKALKKADAVFVRGYGAICAGISLDDAKAVSMIVEKNCKAYIAACLCGKAKSINALESRLMRTVYKLKYSKQIEK